MKIIFGFVALLLTTLATFGQTSGRSERELLKANQEYDEALVRSDAAALDRIYSEDFIYTTPEGESA